MTTSPASPPDASAWVGVLLWRPAPGGREVAALEAGPGTVLPKGTLGAGETERAAAERVARAFTGARTEDPRPVLTARATGEDAEATVSWWRLRWRGQAHPPPELLELRLRWLSLDDAAVELAHRTERELVRAERPRLARRIVERWTRGARAREQRERWRLADREEEVLARPDGPAGPGDASWRARALDRLSRAREALAAGDRRTCREALAEVRRLELHGMDAAERAAVALELRRAASEELPPERRALVEELLDRDPPSALRASRAAALVDGARAARDADEEERRETSTALASVLVVGLCGVWLFAEPGWFAASVPAAPPARLHVGVLLFGLLGGTLSALATPRRGEGWPRVLLRPALGALAGQLVHALLSTGWIQLGQTAPPAWLALAFAAGFAERLLPRGTAPA